MLTPGHYHVVGAAGVGMSALAQALVGAGCTVTGSDRFLDTGDALPVIEQLRGAGIRFCPQDGRAVTAQTQAVVLSTAIEADNPDVQAAQRLGVPLAHRSVILARLAEGRRCVAVTGTSGKSSVTGLVGWILDVAGRDPVVVNGAPVLNWVAPDAVGNYRNGRGDLFVIEADESDKSLLNYTPEWAVITNASRDHFGLEETLALFERFRERVRGGLVSTLHEPGLLAGAVLGVQAGAVTVRVGGRDLPVPLLGRHNAENAFLAATLCARLGVPQEAIADGLRTFRGIARRLEQVGCARGVRVVDDYAHNPAKISAAWAALAPHARALHAVWRPHGYGPLRAMLDDLAAAFAAICRPADRLYILPVYDAGGTTDRSVNADALVARLRAAGVCADAVPGPDAVPALVAAHARAGDVALTMGARDPHLTDLARAILRELSRLP